MTSYYFEKLSIFSFFGLILGDHVARLALCRKSAKVLYIDVSRSGKWAVMPLLRMAQLSVSQCCFEMRNVKDERGELLRVRIFRHDLFDLRRQILSSEDFKALDSDDWDRDGVRVFIEKGVTDGQIMERGSVSRLAYLVGVVKAHSADGAEPVLIVERRAWSIVLERYGREQGVRVVFTPRLAQLSRSRLAILRYRFPRAYASMRAFKDYGWPMLSRPKDEGRLVRVYVEGRGEIRLRDDGYYSDFFWLLNSPLSPQHICYRASTDFEKQTLTELGIKVASIKLSTLFSADNSKKLGLSKPLGLGLEKILIAQFLRSHIAIRRFWRAVFESNSVKLYLTWYRFDRTHVAIKDAVQDEGGIAVYLPISFDGYKQADLTSRFDVAFTFSKFSADIELQSASDAQYQIITGYPRDYAPSRLRAEALLMRQRLLKAGAEKVIFVIDENSVDDSRWHTGHELQRENYTYVLEKVLSTPWLGVVFKPKVARTLRQRLGAVAALLHAAELTKRCYVYEESGRDVTSAPPVHAALVADVFVHGHMCAGTAALECALAGLPTLLIDREGVPDSKLQELPRGKVVFHDWPDAIDELMEHFERPGGIPGFGDWSSLIGKLDPFQDGLAAKRIGDYLSWLVEGFEQGLDRDVVMAKASDRYAAMWGNDKVIRGEATPGRIEADAAFAPRTTVMN
jgi:hypothetical protein